VTERVYSWPEKGEKDKETFAYRTLGGHEVKRVPVTEWGRGEDFSFGGRGKGGSFIFVADVGRRRRREKGSHTDGEGSTGKREKIR